MFFTVSTLHTKRHYRIWLISSPFSFAVTQQKITPYRKKLLTLFLYFLQDQKELDFIIFIYLLQINKKTTNNLTSTH